MKNITLSLTAKMTILLDFDGTITLNDSTTEVVKCYHPIENEIYRDRLREGIITIKQYIQEQLEQLNLSKEQFQRHLIECVKLDPTFMEFALRFPDYYVVSSGSDCNVQTILDEYHVPIKEGHIYSNTLNFTSSGLQLEFPYDHQENGVDKAMIVQRFKKEGNRVVFIGDSYSDYQAALEADLVFARKGMRLEQYCKDHKISCFPFQSFKDISDKLEAIL